MEKKKIELSLTNYICTGSVHVIFWGEDSGILGMTPYVITELSDTDIIAGINDGEWGVQTITHAFVCIAENYEGHLVELEQREYTRNEILSGKREL